VGYENAIPQIKRVGIHCEAHDNNALGILHDLISIRLHKQTEQRKNTPTHCDYCVVRYPTKLWLYTEHANSLRFSL